MEKLELIRRDDLPGAPYEWRMDRVIEGVRYRVADLVDANQLTIAALERAQHWAIAALDGITKSEAPRQAGCTWLRAYRVEE